jgi:Luciferase-like monooxygenase
MFRGSSSNTLDTAEKGRRMEIGASIFFTEYSMAPADLAVALEQRGFDSLWVAEHSHMPVKRRFTHPLGEAALTKEYFDVMDPFVTLSVAAAVTTRLKLATAICLVIQRDTTDREARGLARPGIERPFPLCHRLRLECRGDGRPRHHVRDPHDKDAGADRSHEGDLEQGHRRVSRPNRRLSANAGLAQSRAEKPHPPIIVGGAFRLAGRRAIRYGDGILPAAPSAGSGSPEEFMPRFRKMAGDAGRDPASLSVTLGGAPADLAVLRRNRDLGVTRMTVRLPPVGKDEILPILDHWAKLIPQVNS